ncbi:DEAD/DEAH box helicase [Pseudaquidulcibacter saccharophilus]|uniref:DEAD/DEAH box helicase n=1 Tax=Pseudaquidulcibacter saccharophilus TaxID=2831900 RepID=UPI001EFF3C7D|nr:ATP-binding domain-containing protein [Pseudaquidulcibacter saccharophilus]
MALKRIITTDRWNNDPTSREIVDYLSDNQNILNLENALVYYDFPSYSDYESSVFRPDLLIFSPEHGILAIRCYDPGIFQRSNETIVQVDESLDDFISSLYSKFIKSRILKKSSQTIIFNILPIIFAKNTTNDVVAAQDITSKICSSFENIKSILDELHAVELSPEVCKEVRSIVEGAKALGKPNKRVIENPANSPFAVAVDKIEQEIANFDEKQRHIALIDIKGPARIRGLAGSGKTVILAMKAAHLHLVYPEKKILFTFYTKSLRSTIKSFITKFFRIYSDSDPNWKKIEIRHGWGGSNIAGVYSDACRRAGIQILNLDMARRIAKVGESEFAAACKNLLSSNKVEEYYDYVLIDEGQDFPDAFYQLAYKLTKGERDKKNIIWAYDELQDILNVKIRQPSELFGRDPNGQPIVDLDRSRGNLPPGATNDAVLSKSYRNQKDVLVSSHALGFGVYGEIVQMLESSEHWEDVGYNVLTGPLKIGKPVDVFRPDENSPTNIGKIGDAEIIETYTAANIGDEINYVTEQIKKFVSGGLYAHEIIVICLDDRHAKHYLSGVSASLAKNGIASNNIIADPYNEPPFIINEKVTLSTVYRAKGNEAALVFAVGIDAINGKARSGRNKLFTAFTRTKGWLRASGIGLPANKLLDELKQALLNSPNIRFVMPDPSAIDTIQRGLSKKEITAKKAIERMINDLRTAGFTEAEISEQFTKGMKNE